VPVKPFKPPNRLATGRRRWPWSVRATVIGLLAVLAIELVLIGAHWFRTAPVRKGVQVAARAERSLGAGPLNPRAYRLDYGWVDARAKQLAARRDMAGVAIAVIEDGQLAFVKAYGVADAQTGEKATTETVFRWASVSKGVAATLVTKLAAEGKLSLDDPVSRWSGTIRLPKGNEQVATLANALSHTLGIVKNAYDDKLEENVDPGLIRGELGGLYPMCVPGTCFGYQNVAYDVAREAVEKATGLPYDQAARRMLFEPLGMRSASTTREGLVGAKSWARLHDGRRVLPVEEAYYRVPSAGGVNSSIVDLGIWTRAQMGGAPGVLPQGLLWRLHVPRITTPRRGLAGYDQIQTGNAYGLGFRESDYAGHHLIGHRGAVKGSRSLILFDPETKFGVAMLWNSTAVKPTGMALELFDKYYSRPWHDWMELGRP
jgi:beta-lactamase class C